jgi:hypothetical protein
MKPTDVSRHVTTANKEATMKHHRNPNTFMSFAQHKASLLTAVFVLAGAAFWLAMPVSRPLAEPPGLSMDSIIRQTPMNLPTTSAADTF